ncbi:MAG: four helix bundle protein [Deltaproteobacteria bacterium]|nr:four helix bundle protein [Deltaproteobacteria bacterium]
MGGRMGNEELRDRFYAFALEIVKFVRKLPKEMVAREIGKQLIKSGPSIAANYEEATGGFSKGDFTYKMSTAFKEAIETHLWLRLLRDAEIVTGDNIDRLIKESGEIRNILGKSVTTAKKKTNGK